MEESLKYCCVDQPDIMSLPEEYHLYSSGSFHRTILKGKTPRTPTHTRPSQDSLSSPPCHQYYTSFCTTAACTKKRLASGGPASNLGRCTMDAVDDSGPSNS